MNKIYIVLYNSQVSSEGYNCIDDAISFVENRSYNPRKVNGWFWRDWMDNSYMIKEINIV